MVEKRDAFVKAQPALSRRALVFLDECGISTALNHRYGWSKSGERVLLHAPTYGARRTLVGAIALDGRKVLSVLEKGLRVPSFIEFVRQQLVPMLRKGDVVIMDNLRIHKNPEAIAAIEDAGAEVVFQPPYAPEFNAIEFCWSWVKQDLRRAACRVVDDLVNCALAKWDQVTGALCRQWSRGCGYDVDEPNQRR